MSSYFLIEEKSIGVREHVIADELQDWLHGIGFSRRHSAAAAIRASNHSEDQFTLLTRSADGAQRTLQFTRIGDQLSLFEAALI